MNIGAMNRAWRPVRIIGLAVAVAACVLPAVAKAPATSVGPEKAVGGTTGAERLVRQQQLYRAIAPHVPAGVANAPVYVEITERDRADLAAPFAPGEEPMKIGVVKAIPMSVGRPAGRGFARGELVEQPDGSFVWAVSVSSPGAQAIRLHLTAFSLPPNTEMYLLSDNGQVDGPYTGRGRNRDGDFWTRSVASETGTLMLRYTGKTPDVDLPRMTFVVSEVGHVRGRPPRPLEQNHDSWPCSDNASCVVDATCNTTDPAAAPAEDAVAKMEWIKGPYIYTCTGGLIADTDPGTQIPYFLTANHCLSSSNSNLETFFHYTTDSCNGSCPDSLVTGGTPPPADTVGVTVVASGRKGDYTLMTLNQPPPAGTTFLGWNIMPIASSNGAQLYRISNPNFGPQAYSAHVVDASAVTCTGWPRGERIYSNDVKGATMGGSSGSPVVNGASQIVGQLSGCCGYNCGNVCDSGSNSTVDGALAYYWANVAAYLDPQGGGGGCTTNAECDDGAFCNGLESCVSGACQAGSSPCQAGETCNETTDMCDPSTCGGNKTTCNSNSECCSNNCRNGTCKGN